MAADDYMNDESAFIMLSIPNCLCLLTTTMTRTYVLRCFSY